MAEIHVAHPRFLVFPEACLTEGLKQARQGEELVGVFGFGLAQGGGRLELLAGPIEWARANQWELVAARQGGRKGILLYRSRKEAGQETASTGDVADWSLLSDRFSRESLENDRESVLLWLGRGDSAGRFAAILFGKEGQRLPIDFLRITGPGMPCFASENHSSSLRGGSEGILERIRQNDRFSRTIGALGEELFMKFIHLRYLVVGCGRSGSVAGTTLARMGVRELALLDPDKVDAHSLDSMESLGKEDLGENKAEALGRRLEGMHGVDWPRVRTFPESVLRGAGAWEAFREADVVFCCVDDDAARWQSGALAAIYLRPLIDIGTRVEREEDDVGVRLAGDIRLILPGQGCLLSLGGLADEEGAWRRLNATPWERLFETRAPWHEQRAGSLRTWNGVTVNLGVQLWLDLLAGRVTGSTWASLDMESGRLARPTYRTFAGPHEESSCRICRLLGYGDALAPAREEKPSGKDKPAKHEKP